MLSHYLKVALRNAVRHKGYSLINILGLALGMASAMLIGLYLEDELSYDRYHAQAEHIYRIVDETTAKTPGALGPAIRQAFPEVANTVRLRPPGGVWIMQAGDRVFSEERVFWADGSLFEVFSFPLIQGDARTALHEPDGMVITESTARKYFGDEDPMGKIVRGDDTWEFRITGVMRDIPSNAHFIADFFLAWSAMPRTTMIRASDIDTNWEVQDYYTYVLLSPDASPEALEAKLATFVKTRPGAQLQVPTYAFSLQPLTGIHLHSHLEHELGANSDPNSMVILASIAILILCIACINFVNLTTARSGARAREVGVRKVVGAYRRQMILQFMGEAVLITLLAFLLAMAMAQSALPAVQALTGKTLTAEIVTPGRMAALIGLVLGVGVLSGGYPALVLSAYRPVAVLKGGRSPGPGRRLLREALVVAQFTLAIAFLIGTGVVYEQLAYIQTKSLGFSKTDTMVIPATIAPIQERYETFAQTLRGEAAIENVARAHSVPARMGGVGALPTLPARAFGRPSDENIDAPILSIDYAFLNTLGLSLAAGRNFSPTMPDDWYAVLLNETAARRFGWASPEEAIGQRVIVDEASHATVIGVVRDFHLHALHHPITPLIIVPLGGSYILIRTAPGQEAAGLDAVRDAWNEVYPAYPMAYSWLEEDWNRLYRTEDVLGRLIAAGCLLAVIIAGLGLLGLTAFTVAQRTKEIGIRKALGATAPVIVRRLSTEFLTLVVIANAIAYPVAYAVMNDWLKNFAYRIDIGADVFIWSSLVTLGMVLATVGYHTIKAARANPVDALKYE